MARPDAGASALVLEDCRMGTITFILFVTAATAFVAWQIDRHGKKKKKSAALKNKARAKSVANDRLFTPADNTLAHSETVWARKRARAREDVIATNRFAPRSSTHGEVEYDGYSRRDRSHIVVGSAHIKKEDHVDDWLVKPAQRKEGQFGK
jgi:hypothetical protein